MYEEWPILEFPDIGASILGLFTKNTSESVASFLLYELTREETEDVPSIRLNSEDQLRWSMQVLNHSLTFSFMSNREYNTIRGAVKIYLHWLRALTDLPDGTIPTPLLETPEKYFRTIIEALRCVFCRRDDLAITDHERREGELSNVPRGLAIERQATEIEIILDTVKALTQSASRKYQNEVWARSLSFLLNSADLLLADPSSSEEMGIRVGSRVVDTLFELWFRAVLNEEIPSPTYWRTLSVLCRRWRHHVTVIESWARKLLSMTVLVCRKMYGDEYSRVLIHDDSIIPFGLLPASDEGEIDLLYQSWFNLLCLIGSPATILKHDPWQNKPIHNGEQITVNPNDSAIPSLPLCFFLATTAIQRMIDVFYGDNRVPIEFKESDVLIRKWTLSSVGSEETTSYRHKSEREAASVHTDHTKDTQCTESTLTGERRGSCSSSVSGRDARLSSEMSRKAQKRHSDRSGKNESASQTVQPQYSRLEPSLSQHATSLPPLQMASGSQVSSKAGESVSTRFDVNGKASLASCAQSRPGASHFVGHALSANPLYPAFIGERGPKSERLLNLTMNWLLEASTAGRQDKDRTGGGDVIDGML
ncbi:unnamed protein product [Auanema sp. JU1783]|nr:unnamed protein product [Auanema sp. JU1783]